jgi:hypothetical protein
MPNGCAGTNWRHRVSEVRTEIDGEAVWDPRTSAEHRIVVDNLIEAAVGFPTI